MISASRDRTPRLYALADGLSICGSSRAPPWPRAG